MKLIGFIKEHNRINEAKEYTSILKKQSSTDQAELIGIINYLNKGELLLAWMGYFIDLDDNSLISPDTYYTDGVYVWPAYFPYYLKKHPNYPIDNEFLSHLLKNNFLIDKVSTTCKDALEKKLSKTLNELT